MHLVSVIVPNYNHAPYLDQRIDSILNQTFQDFEIILLDDCSTDNSVEIIKKFSDHPKISQFIVNETNAGSPFKQWKRGIDLARGEFIWIAESDDWCEPTLLATIVDEMIRQPDLVLGYVQSYAIRDANEIIWISKHDKIRDIANGADFIRNNLLHGNAVINASMAVFRKETANTINNEFMNYTFCGDWVFWAEISSKGNVFISGKTLNYFRNHDLDVSSKAYSTGLNFIEELHVLNYFRRQGHISDKDYWQAIQKKYVNFRRSKSKLQKSARTKIKQLFSSASKNWIYKYNLIACFYKELIVIYLKTIFKKILT